jgi:hypothetical protein
MSEEPSYAELYAQRQREWADKQALAEQRLREDQKRLMEMPDVRSAPEIGDERVLKQVPCQCGGRAYGVRRWVLINGIKHRAELACMACGFVGTWDWGEGRWL